MSKEHVKLLEAASNVLKAEEYVCIALKSVAKGIYGIEYRSGYEEDYTDIPAMYDILRYIREALKGCGTVQSWLERDCGVTVNTREEMTFYRQRWIQHMIEHFKDVK